jgi:hypothetical protein
MTLATHARTELELLGEEEETIDWFVRVIEEFASFGHSGGSASICIPMLNELLQFKNLTPLTNNPDEWMNVAEYSGVEMWQNRRNGEAFSDDGGKTYYLLSERKRKSWKNLWLAKTPIHRAFNVHH